MSTPTDFATICYLIRECGGIPTVGRPWLLLTNKLEYYETHTSKIDLVGNTRKTIVYAKRMESHQDQFQDTVRTTEIPESLRGVLPVPARDPEWLPDELLQGEVQDFLDAANRHPKLDEVQPPYEAHIPSLNGRVLDYDRQILDPGCLDRGEETLRYYPEPGWRCRHYLGD
jgi:hypothetical protein